MRKNYFRKGAVVIMAAAMVSTACAGTAFAARANSASVSDDTSWVVPDKPVANVVIKDGKLYKALTEWSNAWATAGADYLGVSNSSWLQGNGGGDMTASIEDLNKTLAGVWSSSVNENPNPYNWNTFYNLYADANGYERSDTATVTATFSTETGVYGPLTYRPEMIWYSNSFQKGTGDTAVEGSVAHINNLEYVSGIEIEIGAGQGGPDGGNKTTVTYDAADSTSQYYIEGDENYNPVTIVAGNGSPLRWVTSLNVAAHEAQSIIDETADYNADGAITTENVNWKNAQALPRATRYNESPVECAVNVEKVTKGAVYYTLEQIAAGNVAKKKVAYVTGNVSDDSNTVDIVVYDYTEQVGQGRMDGTASFSPLVVDQLTTENVKSERVANANTGGANLGNAELYGQERVTLPYTEYYATADDLLSCDYIYAPGGATTEQWEAWLAANGSEENLASSNVQIISQSQVIMQTSNYTSEKLAFGVFAVNSFYPELFPNMSLLSYWYDNVYHINTSDVATVLGYSAANASITAGNELSGIENYSKAVLESKFWTGLNYYNAAVADPSVDTEGTITRVTANLDLDGNAGLGENTWTFTDFAPSADWSAASSEKSGFSDVTDTTEWYYTWIYQAVSKGLFTGYTGSDKFGVNDNLSREQAVTVLWRMMGSQKSSLTELPFADVSAKNADNEWYFDAIAWAYENGVTTGVSSTKFGVGQNVTREDLATLIWRAVGSPEATDTSAFDAAADKGTVDDYAVKALQWTAQNNILSGIPHSDGTKYLSPTQNTNRAQAAKIYVQADRF